jgi:hypothetical protein
MTIRASRGLRSARAQAGYKTAMNPPSQSFKNPLATWEASI